MPKSVVREVSADRQAELDRLAELAEQDREALATEGVRRRRRLESLGATLRYHREKAGLTLADLSARCGIDSGRLSQIENGKANVTIGTLDRYAEAIGHAAVIGLVEVSASVPS